MQTNFRTYETAIEFARLCRRLSLPLDLKDQLNRASASIALNLNEGSAAHTAKERRRFYIIALRSFRETEAIARIADVKDAEFTQFLAQLGGLLYRLCKATG